MSLPTPDIPHPSSSLSSQQNNNHPSNQHVTVSTVTNSSLIPAPPLSHVSGSSSSLPVSDTSVSVHPQHYMGFQLAPATLQRVVTTTTTTTLALPPVLIPRPKSPPILNEEDDDTQWALHESGQGGPPKDPSLGLNPKRYPLAKAEVPWNLKRFSLESLQATANAKGSSSKPLIASKLAPQTHGLVYDQVEHVPGGGSSLPNAPSEAHPSSQATTTTASSPSSWGNKRGREPTPGSRLQIPSEQLPRPNPRDKGKSKAKYQHHQHQHRGGIGSKHSTRVHPSSSTTATTYGQRRRRSISHSIPDSSADDDGDDRIGPPPRKRARQNSLRGSHHQLTVSRPGVGAGGGGSGGGGDDDIGQQGTGTATTSSSAVYEAAALPSPNLSPPSPVETTCEEDGEEDGATAGGGGGGGRRNDRTMMLHKGRRVGKSTGDSGCFMDEEMDMNIKGGSGGSGVDVATGGAIGVSGGTVNMDQFIKEYQRHVSEGSSSQQQPPQPAPNSLSLSDSHSSSFSALLSLPSLVTTFSGLPPSLQSYVLFSLLRRSPRSVLQSLNTIIEPSLRRDYLTDLPPELAIQVLTYLDHRSLCRSAQVCKGWARLIDGEWRIWRDRLKTDGLWYDDDDENDEGEVREIELELKEGKKRVCGKRKVDLEFLRNWNGGVWDEGGDNDDDDFYDASPPAPVARSPPSVGGDEVSRPRQSDARVPSKLNQHYIHPYKIIYQRRFVIRQRWREHEPIRTSFPGHASNVVTCLQFDKNRIISASDDHHINVYDTKTGELIQTLGHHEGGVWALEYIGNVLVSGSTDRTVRVWNLDSFNNTHIFMGHTSTVRCLQIVKPINVNSDPKGEPIWEPPFPLIVTGSRDYTLRVWKLPNPNRDPWYLPEVPQSPNDHNVDPNKNPFHLRLLRGHNHAVRALAAHGRILVSGSYDHDCRVWDMLTGECIHVLKGHTQKVYSIVLDPQNERCMSGSMDGTVRIWCLETGEPIHVLDGHSSLVGLLGLSTKHLMSAAADSTLRIWDPDRGRCRHILAAHSGAITCFRHDDDKVVSGSDGNLKLWNVRDGTFVRDLIVGLAGVWQVGFTDRYCVAAVQRNNQSEFEILDFGPFDWDNDDDDEDDGGGGGGEFHEAASELFGAADDEDKREVFLIGGGRKRISRPPRRSLATTGDGMGSPRLMQKLRAARPRRRGSYAMLADENDPFADHRISNRWSSRVESTTAMRNEAHATVHDYGMDDNGDEEEEEQIAATGEGHEELDDGYELEEDPVLYEEEEEIEEEL